MPTVKYVGPFDAVEVPSLDLVVIQGQEVEIPQEALSGLVDQTDAWQVTEG